MAQVKVCPVCDAESAPSARRCGSCGAMLIGVDLTEKGEAAAPGAAGAARCVYCDRDLQPPAAAAPALRAVVRWHWTEDVVVEGCLVVGREPPAPPALAARLERDYANVSRRHAELRVSEGALWIVDLGSTNGTFVNDTRLAPNQPVRLANGARLRFAASLVAHVALSDGG